MCCRLLSGSSALRMAARTPKPSRKSFTLKPESMLLTKMSALRGTRERRRSVRRCKRRSSFLHATVWWSTVDDTPPPLSSPSSPPASPSPPVAPLYMRLSLMGLCSTRAVSFSTSLLVVALMSMHWQLLGIWGARVCTSSSYPYERRRSASSRTSVSMPCRCLGRMSPSRSDWEMRAGVATTISEAEARAARTAGPWPWWARIVTPKAPPEHLANCVASSPTCWQSSLVGTRMSACQGAAFPSDLRARILLRAGSR
mmetsp:Transcript_68214/g.215785  ORF Transcript_68214/g.215785 Transcript_68214/m.215785 type:complete len:256 (-) Transcript_68214:224-991(-)